MDDESKSLQLIFFQLKARLKKEQGKFGEDICVDDTSATLGYRTIHIFHVDMHKLFEEIDKFSEELAQQKVSER